MACHTEYSHYDLVLTMAATRTTRRNSNSIKSESNKKQRTAERHERNAFDKEVITETQTEKYDKQNGECTVQKRVIIENKTPIPTPTLSKTQQAENKKFNNKVLMDSLKNFLRKRWYKFSKFVADDRKAVMFIMDAVQRNTVSVPANMSDTQFIKKKLNKVYTAMSQLRRNSQTLARNNYLGKYWY